MGLLALGSAIAIAPPWVSAAAFAGVLVFVLLLVQPLVGVFLLAWSVPFQSLVATTLGEFRVSITEVLVLLYVAAALLSLRRTRGLPRPLLLLPGLVLCAVLMLSILRSQDIESSLEEIIKWAELLAVYVVTVLLLRVTRWRWWVVGGLLVAAMAEAGVGLVQTLGRIGPEHFLFNGVLMRAHGTFGQPNPFAGYLVLFFPIALALWAFGDLEARLPWIRSCTGLVVIVLGSALLASLSRGGLLGMARRRAGGPVARQPGHATPHAGRRRCRARARYRRGPGAAGPSHRTSAGRGPSRRQRADRGEHPRRPRRTGRCWSGSPNGTPVSACSRTTT